MSRPELLELARGNNRKIVTDGDTITGGMIDTGGKTRLSPPD
jgi:hypothetical protein